MRISIGVDPDSTTTAVAVILEYEKAVIPSTFEVVRTKSFDLASVGRGIVDHLDQFLNVIGEAYPQTKFNVLVTVEEPQIYAGVRTRPQDIAHLGMVTGAVMGAVGAARRLFTLSRFAILDPLTVLPAKWKGQLPKSVSQARTWRAFGIPCQVAGSGDRAYCVPTLDGGCLEDVAKEKKILKSDWRHLGDALGIALWRLDQPG